MDELISRNPATGDIIRRIPKTPIDQLPHIFGQARAAHKLWASVPVKKRAQHLIHLRETILTHLDDLIQLIHLENGKPAFEAMINDLLPSVELLTYFGRHGAKILKDRPIRLHNPVLWHRRSYLNYWPLGVVAVISPWNFPFLLPFGEIAMALLAGNAVIFKPSEVTPLIGLRIQELCEEAGFPSGIIQTVVGEGSLGAAMIDQRPDKIFFTGSVSTGKKVMEAASKYLIPVCLELGGKDPMIVLADADLDYATSAALWGGFANSGQVCASTERLLLHESIEKPFLAQLKDKIDRLRYQKSDERDYDLGVVTMDKQKRVYEDQIADARQNGATFLTGGDFNTNKTALQPTVVSGHGIENLRIFNEETFGPVLASTTFKSTAEAVEKANRSPYGLLASVITQNIQKGEEIAKQLEAGTVTVNEVMYTAGIPETPWGGVKDSGFGRKHSDLGLMEFVHVRHIHKPKSTAAIFKSWWWFPYTSYQYEAFRRFFDLYRKSWLAKLRALPLFLWNFVQFLKKEKRL